MPAPDAVAELPPPPAPATEPAHAVAVGKLLARLGTDLDRGLSEAEAAARRAESGPNELAETPPPPLWRKILAQLTEAVVLVLLAAALLSAAIGQWTDALAILAIVVLNTILGVYQERRAEHALAALRKLSAPLAKVVRGGVPRAVPTRDLVPGDLVELEAGDYVPADVRLLAATGLRVQEAALTGESEPTDKEPDAVLGAATPLGDRRNMAYLGTVVAGGKAIAVVTATGMRTELGRIAGLLQTTAPEPTPLQRRLSELGRVISVGCLVLAAGVFALELARGTKLTEVLLLAVSLAVAAVPEGLPAVVTVALTLGLQRMVRRNALIRKLPSVETLGSVTVICSDKTGTLTRNEMTVREAVVGGTRYRFTGAGYTPIGQILTADDVPLSEPGGDLAAALTAAARCNAARLVPGAGDAGWQVVGDPTEGALLVAAAAKGGVEPPAVRADILWEIPFDSERKMMSVAVKAGGGAVMYTKGAPEVVLGKCATERRDGRAVPLTPDRRTEIARDAAGMASRAVRVLALAYRDGADGPDRAEEGLVFAGLVGMMDPPREEAREAVRKCHEAGIRPVMITGDHPATALAVARELGIARDGDAVVTGAELDGLSDDELTGRVTGIAVYARVAAEHKLRVVRAWQRAGQVVAMTGDGVNDAPAVRAADIGIAMGTGGTDVTKEASAMVLTDDNFASIVSAVEEGRGVYDNIQKFLQYLFAGNIGLVLFIVAASLFGWPFPLTATQILWMNLVTNGLPALALGMEPPERDIMRRKPRPPREPVLTARTGLRMFVHGLLVAAVTAVGFALVYRGDEANLPRARTMAFCVVSFAFVFYALSCRSFRRTMPELGFFTNPMLLGAIAVSCLLQLAVVTLPFARPVFETAAHFGWEWGILALLALTPVTVIEVSKLVRARLSRTGNAEPAPRRGVMSVARKVLLVAAPLLLVGGAVLAVAYWPSGKSDEGTAQGEWTCSMHPQVRLPGPGKCPICGMDLIPVEQLAAERARIERTGGVETEVVGYRELTKEVRTVGKLDYNEARVAYITARVAGRVERVYADFTGVQVKKGDHLVEIYSPDLVVTAQNLREALASGNDTLAQIARDRLRLWGLLPEQIKEIETAKESPVHLTVRSPIGGTVIEKAVRKDQYLKEGDPLYKVADLDPIWLYMDVYESDPALHLTGGPGSDSQ